MSSQTAPSAKPVANETLLKQLQWRYATKKFDPTKKISEADWKTLEESLILAPSSYGLQPWKFIVIKDPAMREKLKGASWGQQQIVDASHMVVFALRKGLGPDFVKKYIDRIVEVQHVPPESLEGIGKMMADALATRGDQWSARQVYIAVGFLLSAAAMLGIDACPMEGIENAKYDEILGLEKQGLTALCVVTVGYRAADCKYATMPKVRFKREDVIAHV